MNKPQSVAARVGASVAVVALLGFFGIAPAGAAEGDTLYTATSPDTDGADPATLGTIDTEGPTFAAIGAALPANLDLNGIDLFGETGYAIAYDLDLDSYVVFTWDHNTGAISTPVLITQTIDADGSITSVWAADTLADGTLIAFLALEFAEAPTEQYVVSIDPVTGVATELVNVTGATDYLDSLATDPTTEITYALVDEDDGMPEFLELDLVGNSYTGPTALTGINSSLGAGWIRGADFDSAGILWFYYSSSVLAATNGAFGATVGADFVGGTNYPDDIVTRNLTVGPPVVKPALAATGLDIAGVAIGAGVLLAAGFAVVFVGRRRATV